MIKAAEYAKEHAPEPVEKVDALAAALGLTYVDGAYTRVTKSRGPYKRRTSEVSVSRGKYNRWPAAMYVDIERMDVGDTVNITQYVRGYSLYDVRKRIAQWTTMRRKRNGTHISLRVNHGIGGTKLVTRVA